MLGALRRRAQRDLLDEGHESPTIALGCTLDVRYCGQSHELRIPATERFVEEFHTEHERAYGYADREREVEVVNLRVIATVAGAPLVLDPLPQERNERRTAPLRWRGRWMQARVCQLGAVTRTASTGPLVVVDFSSTTFVPPGWQARSTADGDLLLERVDKRKGSRFGRTGAGA
jgi:N-methylhydantoinase A